MKIFINPTVIWELGDSSCCVLSLDAEHLGVDLIVIYLVEMNQWGHLTLCFALGGYLGGHFIAFGHMSGILRGILFAGRAPWRALYHIMVGTDLLLIKQV